jgi:hypothetical protein
MRGKDSFTVFGVITNSDLTEGRGTPYIQKFCFAEATAKRLAEKAGVQGRNARVAPVTLRYGPCWLAPISIAQIHTPTPADNEAQRLLDEKHRAEELKEAALNKARAAGLSDEDIEALRA